jgi:quercetin dioxygenase-like cupin family protein
MAFSSTVKSAVVLAVMAAASWQALGAAAQSEQGTTYVSQSGTRLRLLLDERGLGGKEAELGEMTFPPNLNSGEHQHGAVEIFYVISGALEHVVNGKSTILKPGMVGFVRPPDKVAHRTGPGGPTKVLVMWAPAGEAARVTARWKKEP